jgi:branched-chain amino acid transport system permease protein
MDIQITALLLQDGVTMGAIYVLLAVALVMVFNVTRIVFVPQGEFVSYTALTLAVFDSGQLPKTVWLLLASGLIAFAMEIISVRKTLAEQKRKLLVPVALYVAGPVLIALLSIVAARPGQPLALRILMTLAIVIALAPSMYRIAFKPIADASPLTLFVAAISLHFVLTGLGLHMFGPEAMRTPAFAGDSFQFGFMTVHPQFIWVLGLSGVLIFCLYFFFGKTIYGKALRASAVSRRGAHLMGISTNFAGGLTVTLAAVIGAISGILIGPMTSMKFDSGFLLSLKGFVGAIIGGLALYPMAAIGALFVGVLETFASFWASAYKEVIVFTLIVPILLWRSTVQSHTDEESEE